MHRVILAEQMFTSRTHMRAYENPATIRETIRHGVTAPQADMEY